MYNSIHLDYFCVLISSCLLIQYILLCAWNLLMADKQFCIDKPADCFQVFTRMLYIYFSQSLPTLLLPVQSTMFDIPVIYFCAIQINWIIFLIANLISWFFLVNKVLIGNFSFCDLFSFWLLIKYKCVCVSYDRQIVLLWKTRRLLSSFCRDAVSLFFAVFFNKREEKTQDKC